MHASFASRFRITFPPVHVSTALLAGLLILAVGAGSPAHAQNAGGGRTPPHAGFAYPAGGIKGSTFTLYIGGQNLDGATQIHVSNPAVTAKILGYERPMTQKQFNDLREKMQALLQKRAAARGLPAPERAAAEGKKGEKKRAAEKAEAAAPVDPDAPRPTWTAADEKMLADLRVQMAKRPNRQGNPAIAETVTVELSIMPEAAPGSFDLRIQTPAGLSNPVMLQIGELPEYAEPVVTATTNPAPRKKREAAQRPTRPQAADMEIAIPATVNGQILPGEVDRYRFAAKKGQHLTVAVSARTLMPYLADAVPGWFQATLGLYDPQGREVAYSDSFRFSPDPVVNFAIPEDGTYAIEIKDSIYRGREDFVYRIAIGELPFVTSLFPLGGRASDTASFELTGWNLSTDKIAMNTKDKDPGVFMLSVRGRGQLSNSVRFALDEQEAIREVEPADGKAPQALTLPIIVDGRIQAPGDTDVFRFEGKAGEPIVAEVFARRLGSPLDSILKLTDASGKELAANDDYEDRGVGLMTHHADSRIAVTLPATGTYFLTLADTQRHGAPEYGYRVRVGAPHPDFELRVVPSGINARAGTHVPITVYALRRDGFNGEIRLALKDAPVGMGLSGARIPAGQDKVQLTLAAPVRSDPEPVKLEMYGAATIGGQSVVRLAVPAEDMMQAFAYHHLVPAKDFLVSVNGRGGACRLLTRPPLQLSLGGTAHLTIGTTAARGVENLKVELSDPPPGITVKSVKNSGSAIEVEIACDATKAKAGLQGNLILNAFGERQNPKAKAAAQRVQRVPLGSVPAIPFEVFAGPGPAKT